MSSLQAFAQTFRPGKTAAFSMAVVLAIGLGASLFGAMRQDEINTRQITEDLSRQFDRAQQGIQQRFVVYEDGLTDLRAALAATAPFTTAKFDVYAAMMDANKRFSGALGFGLVARVPRDKEAEFLRRVENDGDHYFRIQQFAPHDGDRYVVRHFKPIAVDWSPKGWDIGSEEKRRQTADQSARSGRISLSSPLILARDVIARRKSFIIMIPFYATSDVPPTEEARVKSLSGWIYAPLVLDHVIGPEILDNRLLHLTISDASDVDGEFYNSPDINPNEPKLYPQRREIEMYGHRWIMEFSAHPAYLSGLQQLRPLNVFLLGTLITLLSVALIAALLRSWRQGVNTQLAEKDRVVAELMANLSAGVIQINSSATIVFANPRAGTILGYRDRDMVGLSVLDLGLDIVDEWGTPLARNDIERMRMAAMGTPVHNLILGIRSPDTSGTRWILMNADPRFSDPGVVARVDLSFIDITAQINARQSLDRALVDLKQAHALLAHTEQIAQTGGWSVDYDTGDVTWTPGTYLIHDLEAGDESALKEFVARTRATRSPEFRAKTEEARQQAGIFEMEHQSTTAKGRQVWLKIYGEPIVRNGRVTGATGYMQNITAQKLARQEVVRALEELERTEAIARVGGWTFDVEHQTGSWTAGSYRIYDLEPGDTAGMTRVMLASHESMGPEYRAKLAAAIEQGVPYEVETETTTVRGRKIYVYARGTPVMREGKVVALVGHLQDVTLQRETEARLRASQKMEAVGQLTAGVAHDFNNLLTVVMTNMELLQEEHELTPFMSARIEAALKATERGASLTRHLLAFGRNQALTPRRADLRDVVARTISLLKRTLPDQIQVRISAATAPVWAKIDEAQLENALINLSLNARDAMPDGGNLTFTIHAATVGARYTTNTEELQPGDYAVIEVEDNGCGMPDAVKSRAFDPFFTTKAVGKGTGLGLSMVYGFVRQSGGYVHLESATGRGTTFTLHFPLSSDAEPEATPVYTPPIKTMRGHVLLVEDMEDVREAVAAQLRSFGFDVITAHDGLSALNVVDTQKPLDLVVTDLGLPGYLNGDKLADEIERRRPGIKIMTMTGYNRDRVHTSGSKKKENRVHMRKPFSRNDLKTAVNELLTNA